MPIKLDDDDPRNELYAEQREKWGFDDTETWNIDVSFAEWLLPRLKRFKEITCVHSIQYSSQEEWNEAVIDPILAALELMVSDRNFVQSESDRDTIQKGMRLFGENVGTLWW